MFILSLSVLLASDLRKLHDKLGIFAIDLHGKDFRHSMDVH